MKKLSKAQIYKKMLSTSLKDIDKNLSEFLKNKKLISKQSRRPPDEFEY